MIRALYTANRNLNVLQKRLENNSANMANVKTPGYKFQDLVQSTLEAKDMINYQGTYDINRKQNLGKFTFGNQIDEAYRNFNQGNLQNTMMETDFAIIGSGFFSVRLPNGEIGYTKNGNFRIDDNSRLVTAEGYPVLAIGPNGGRVEIRVDSDDIKVNSRGEFLNENLRFAIVEFNNNQELRSIGDTIFTSQDQGVLLNDSDVRQGYIEMSNVNMADQMVSLIEISRQFESTQKVVQMADETMGKAVNEIGRV